MSLTYDDLAHEAAERAADENFELRAAIFDAYRILGFDTSDGNLPTEPKAPDFLRQFATEARADYDAACDDAHDLRDQRDQARRIAVALEQENAELAAHVAVQAAGHERYRDLVRGCTYCTAVTA